MPRSLRIEDLTSPEIRDLVAQEWTTVIVPLGATEQHGPGLPLRVDSEHGLQTALRAALRLGRTLVGPVVSLGVSPEHVGFAWTVSLTDHQELAAMPAATTRTKFPFSLDELIQRARKRE
jgi:creatinine amidohydrolase/Fe(II)-dependent formamide hydrolase-like protein